MLWATSSNFRCRQGGRLCHGLNILKRILTDSDGAVSFKNTWPNKPVEGTWRSCSFCTLMLYYFTFFISISNVAHFTVTSENTNVDNCASVAWRLRRKCVIRTYSQTTDRSRENTDSNSFPFQTQQWKFKRNYRLYLIPIFIKESL